MTEHRRSISGLLGRVRHLILPACAVAVALTLSACDNRRELEDGPEQSTTTLVVSEAWMQSAAGDVDVQARLAMLQGAIKQLRKETGTGWIGRQDDVTGYLGQLSGGSWVGAPTDFMDTYGPDLFGIDSGPLSLGPPDTSTVPGMTSVRAGQVLGGVPVLDAVLQITSRNGSTAADDRLMEIRGRVFPGLTVSTEPQVGRKRARAVAEERSGGQADGEPRLVVLPDGPGVLAWEVSVVEGDGAVTGIGLYYIDAMTGELVTVRPGSADLGAPLPTKNPGAAEPSSRRSAPRAEPDPNTVEVTGVDPTGKPVAGQGVRTDRGIELRDTTTPAWDASTQRGEISTYDASGVRNDSQLPGELVVSPTTEVTDAEAIAAHSYSRKVIDYFTSLGRNSWDDTGASMVGSVHYGPPDFCNAFFGWGLNPPQMVFGPPCQEEGSESNSFVEIDVTGHEITHGVTRSSANLIYAGQSGALNESFSDYFGNVVGDRVRGADSSALGEGLCVGITTENNFCKTNPDGSMSLRYMLNGTDFDDYLRILNPGLRLNILELATQDKGGVHLNSAIWNNSLWSIRTQLARIDGQTGIESPLAQAFDKAVYGALATRLTPTSGFIEARAAVEQVIIDSNLDPTVLRVAREVFDANKICVGCPTPPELAGDPITATPQAQLDPSVSGDLVTWLDMSAGEYVGSADSVRLGSGSTPSTGAGNVLDVTLAGEAVVVINGSDQVVRYDESGETLLERGRGDLMFRGLVGSDAGAAWAPSGARLAFVDPAGKVSSTDVPNLNGDPIISVGTGGGTVAAGTRAGKVVLWTPGQGVRQMGTLPGMIASVASHGDNVLATFCTQEEPGKSVPACGVRLLTEDGRSYTVSNNGTVLGAAISDEYAVWPEAIGKATSDVTPKGTKYPDTDLYLLSLRTGKIYSVLQEGGQQGFPAISGRRLVWQDATFGGDDILTAELPTGL